ncbi:MAG: hypothetical protein WBY71_05635 [Nitrososphaeraceae archaeon]
MQRNHTLLSDTYVSLAWLIFPHFGKEFILHIGTIDSISALWHLIQADRLG